MLPESAPEFVPRRGLLLLLDILIAPRRAYAGIAATAEWWPAAVFVALSVVISVTLTVPAGLHVLNLTAKPATPPQATLILIVFQGAIAFLWQVFSWNIVASLYANFCAAGRPAFAVMHRIFFALAAVATVPTALGALASGVAVWLREPASFHTASQIVNALPISLAVFADPKNANEVNFLSNFDLTTVWSILLIAFGGRAIGGIRLVPALIVPCTVALAWAVIMVLPEVLATR